MITQVAEPATPGYPEGIREAVVQWGTAMDEWTDWLRAGNLSALTIYGYRFHVRAMFEYCLKHQWRQSPWRVTGQDLAAWLAFHADQAAGTQKARMSAVRSFYAWAARTHHREDPTLELPKIRIPHAVPRPIPDAVFSSALSEATDRDRLILLLGAYAGLRRAEIAKVRWTDIADGHLRVVGKGDKPRTIPVHPLLARALSDEQNRRARGVMGSGYRYQAGVDGPWLFPNRDGNSIRPDRVSEIARELLGGGWTTHSLRHRCATRLLATSGNLRLVQELLGHEDMGTTAGYTRVADEALAAAVNAL